MLGAQARAAELAAVSAAKQRQVSRELEDRQLPPNPAISLSAFTKPQPQPSRNKGNKAWKPLILDEIVETDPPDPVFTPSNADRLTAKEASDKKVPTAPRAMVADRSLSTVVAYPQPSKPQPSPVINVSARQTQGYGPTHHGGLPYPAFPQNMYLQQFVFPGGMPFNDLSHHETYGSMMVPDDISPTKQEQKFSMLENVSFPHMIHVQRNSQFPMDQHEAFQTFGHDQWDNSQAAYYPGYQVPYQQPQHMSGAYENEIDHFSKVSVQRSVQVESAPNQRTISPIDRSFDQQLRESPVRYQEPYDTEKAMKECVNQLKEKAKDGKSVLYNPEIQREPPQKQIMETEKSAAVNSTVRKPSSVPQPLVPWDVRPKDSRVNQWEVMPPPTDPSSNPVAFNNNEVESNLDNIKPAPGLPFPSIFGPPQLSLESLKVDAIDSLRAPAVGSIEWMKLAPITTAERNRVRRRMAIAAKSITNEVPSNGIATGQNREDLGENQKWFYTDGRGERLLRQQVDLSAQAHASKVIADIRARNSGELPEQFQDGKDDGLAATLILGNVACNLQTYLVGDRKSIEQRRNFHKVKSVPDWCTERGGIALGSYFDGAAGGFYGAPVRVARDPRFRPQVKEGMKVKPEEEWKNRHEMYGRRIM